MLSIQTKFKKMIFEKKRGTRAVYTIIKIFFQSPYVLNSDNVNRYKTNIANTMMLNLYLNIKLIVITPSCYS